MPNPFIDFQRRRDQRVWEQGEPARRERAAHESAQNRYQDFFREAIPQAQAVGPVVWRLMHQLRFALYGNDRDYWVTHWILALDTVMKTDFTRTDPQSILKYPSDEDQDRSTWPIAEWAIIRHFSRNPACTPSYTMTDRRHPQGYTRRVVSVSFFFTPDRRVFFSCRRSTDRRICIITEAELVRCLSQMCWKEEEKPYQAKHRPRF
jgi:hypothetical protein